jgi:hypothetical protein
MPIPALLCCGDRPIVPGPTRLKNAQQTTPGAHRKRNSVHINYPYHPFTGQTVEVVRPYHSKEEQPYWDITLPDGTRAFVPASWTQGDDAPSGLFSRNWLPVRCLLWLNWSRISVSVLAREEPQAMNTQHPHWEQFPLAHR